MNALFYLSLERLPLGLAVAFEFIGPLSVALFMLDKNTISFGWVVPF
jgi:inner membrane transporter RhtA